MECALDAPKHCLGRQLTRFGDIITHSNRLTRKVKRAHGLLLFLLWHRSLHIKPGDVCVLSECDMTSLTFPSDFFSHPASLQLVWTVRTSLLSVLVCAREKRFQVYARFVFKDAVEMTCDGGIIHERWDRSLCWSKRGLGAVCICIDFAVFLLSSCWARGVMFDCLQWLCASCGELGKRQAH